MKKVKEKLLRTLVSFAKHESKTNINSTGSAWSYQPKMPKKIMDYKKK